MICLESNRITMPLNNSKYGLLQQELDAIISILSSNSNVEQAILYGSRAKGNFKRFSDIDITLKGDRLTMSDLTQLSADIDNLLLPYELDLSLLSSLKNPDLIEEISRTGILLLNRI